MRWTAIAPAITSVALLGAVVGGIRQEDSTGPLATFFFLAAALLLGVLLVEVIVAWWIDVHDTERRREITTLDDLLDGDGDDG